MNFLNKVSHLEESLEGSSKNSESSEANKTESLAGSESKSGNESGSSNLLGFAEELGKTFFKKGTENDVKNEFNKMDKGKTGFITFENALKLLAMFNGNFDTQAILNFKNKFSGSGSGSSGGSKIGLKDIMGFFKK